MSIRRKLEEATSSAELGDAALETMMAGMTSEELQRAAGLV